MRFGKDVACRTFRVAIFIRIIKQSQFIFGFQNTTTSRIQCFHRDFSFLNGFLQCPYKTLAYHIHIHSGVDGTGGYCLKITDTVVDHF